MSTLYRGMHFVLQHYQASRYVRLVRSLEPFASPGEAAVALGLCGNALKPYALCDLGILLDWRRAPMSTDPALHRAVVEHTDTFAAQFARRAVLLATPVGQMQVGRVIHNFSAAKPIMFNDEAAAVEHVSWRSTA